MSKVESILAIMRVYEEQLNILVADLSRTRDTAIIALSNVRGQIRDLRNSLTRSE